MKTFELRNAENEVFAFEVPNFGRHRIAKFLEATPGVRVIRKQKRFAIASDDEFCEFEFQGQRFVVYEAFGDSSRFWVGTRPPKVCPQLEHIRAAFASRRAWWLF